jgi:ketosteroid isomerase-like protein
MTMLDRASIAVLSAAWLLMAGAAAADPVREAVEAGNRAFAAAFAAGDAAGVAALYTEEAVLVPPGAALVTGRPAIAAFWQGAMDGGTKAVALTTAEVESAGDLAYELGTARLTADGAVSEARYVVVWKRVANRWYLHRDIWNAEK